MTSTASLSLEQVKQRSFRGLTLLVLREGMIKIIAMVGQLVLVKLLVPEYFGVIAVVSFLVNTSDLFSDVGLVSSVIRSEKTLSQAVLSSLFWVKMGLEAILSLLLLISFPLLTKALPVLVSLDVRIFGIFLLTLFVRPLRSLIYGLLERELRYDMIPFVDILGLVLYFAVAVFCALRGMGVWSLVWSVLLKDIFEIFLLEFFHPFIPSPRCAWKDVRPFLKFGIAVQGNTIIGTLQQSTIPLLGGMLVSPSAIGLLDWSYNIASLPRSLTDNVGRISFSSFSRIQKETFLLGKAIEESLGLMTLVVSFFILASFFFSKEVIQYLIGPVWVEASFSLTWILLAEFFLAIVGVLQQAIIVRGNAGELTKRTFISLLVQWAAVFVLVRTFGFIGIAMGICVGMMLQAGFCFVLMQKTGIQYSLKRILLPVFRVTTCMFFVGFILSYLPNSFLWLVGRGSIFALLFFVCSYVIANQTILRAIHLFQDHVGMRR